MSPVPRILVLDNQDSFTFNVVQGLRATGAATGVIDSRDLLYYASVIFFMLFANTAVLTMRKAS